MPLDSDVTVPRGRTWRDLPDAPPTADSPATIPDAMTPPPAQAVTGVDTVELQPPAMPPPQLAPVAEAAPRRRPPLVWILTGTAAAAALAIVLAAAPWQDDDGTVVAGVAVDSVPRRIAPLPEVPGPDTITPEENTVEVPDPSPPGGEIAPEGPAPDGLDDLFGGGGFGEELPPELRDLLEGILSAPEADPDDPGLVPPELAPLLDLLLDEGLGAEGGVDGLISPQLQSLLGRMLAGEELSPQDLLWLMGSPEMQDLLDDLIGNG